MRIRSFITFVLAVFLCLAAAQYRWGDSSHAIGLMSMNGGKARHPSFLESGWAATGRGPPSQTRKGSDL